MLTDTFYADVERMVSSGASYIDAVTTWCAERGLEPEAGAEFVQKYPLIASRLQLEAESLRMIRFG